MEDITVAKRWEYKASPTNNDRHHEVRLNDQNMDKDQRQKYISNLTPISNMPRRIFCDA